MRYVRLRLVAMVPTVLIVSIIIFLLMRVIPGDAATFILVGPRGENLVTPEDIKALQRELGTDRPYVVQYLDWMVGLVRLDVGDSLWTGEPV